MCFLSICQSHCLQIFSPILRADFQSYLLFPLQKLWSLIRSHLFIFVFIFITLGCCSKRLLWFTSKSVLPVYSSKSLIVFDLTFRSLIYFEFIFLCSVREYCNFILLHVVVQFFQHHLLKRLSFLHFIFLPPMSSIRLP